MGQETEKPAAEVVSIGVNDKERAADLRLRLAPLVEEIAKIMAEGQRDGLKVSFQIQIDTFGRPMPTLVDVVRML